MAGDNQQYPDYGQSTSSFYCNIPQASRESFASHGRHQAPQGGITQPTLPGSGSIEGWNSINISSSSTLGLDGYFRSDLGSGERYNSLQVSNFPQPSSRTLQVPSHMQYEISPDPISRFQNIPGPWVPKGIADIPEHLVSLPRQSSSATASARYNEPNPLFSRYRTKTGSDRDSDITGPYPSDSGYGTRSQATTSILSSDLMDHSQECSSLSGQIDSLDFYPKTPIQVFSHSNSQVRAQRLVHPSGPEQCQSTNLHCPYPDCRATVKCQSELKKHIRRHERPYKCEQPGCNRREGFSTINDLDRHKKSVHNIAPKHGHDRSFRCPVKDCSRKDKIWPRLDNFRQHLKRMHQHDPTEELLSKAEREAHALQQHNQSHVQGLEYGPSLGYAAAQTGPEDIVGPSDYVSNTWSTLEDDIDERDGSNAQYRPLSSQASDGSDDLFAGLSVPCQDTHPRSSRFLSTVTVAPLARSVSQGSWSSKRPPCGSPSNHFSLDRKPAHTGSRTTPRLNPFSARSGELLGDTRQSPSASITAPSGSEQLSVARQPPLLTQNVASPRFSPTVEDVSQAITSGVANCIKPGTLDEAQMQTIVQTTLLHLIGRQATRQTSVRSRSPNHTTARGKPIPCDECEKTLVRHCDMKKHKKRHSKPYGCTFRTCNKTFGSKNDWKRHENSQHFQLECWRCLEPDADSEINQCAKLYYRRETFESHLRQHHQRLSDNFIKDEVRRTRIGRNGQGQFWCGFCRKIIKLESKGLEAWDERFNHVDDKHFKNGQRISDWIPVDRREPKGPQLEDTVPDSMPFYDQDEDDDNFSEAGACPDAAAADLPHKVAVTATPMSLSKRDASSISSHAPPSKRQRTTLYRYCCECNNPLHFDCCTACDHKHCHSCSTETVKEDVDD